MENAFTNILSPHTVILTGGGTGGHIYPNLALLPDLAVRGMEAVYIGGEGDTPERRLATKAGLSYYGTETVKLIRSMSPGALKNNLRIPFALKRATDRAEDILRHISPDIVFSKGGFVSLPTVLAAKRLGIPIVAHESDLTLGLANKIAKVAGATILKANPDSKFDGIFVGMPLRRALFGIDPREARKRLGINAKKPVLLVLGGSSGAKFLNDAVKKMLEILAEQYFVLHVTGKAGEKIEHQNYASFEYADNIGDFYAAADVILSRAGATAVFEISALEKRAVFVPLPKGISRGDQPFNAALAQSLGAVSLCQNEQFYQKLLPSLETALQNAPMRALAADANGKIADIIYDSIRRGVKCKDKKRSQNGLR